MAFRNVIIKNRAKLECSLNYLICRKDDGVTKILLDEIKTIVIDTIQVSITSNLISECLKKKIKMIFTEETHNPVGEIVPYQNNYYSYRHIKEQISFDDSTKKYLWKEIIREKIKLQKLNLDFLSKVDAANKLDNYYNEVDLADITNREGHAAKVYFNTLFESGFTRSDSSRTENKYLDYGYSIILSTINKEIKCLGYLTELGIHHIGESNQFNLSCDFMEPLRPYVDYLVISKKVNELNYKSIFIEMLSHNVIYYGKTILLENAIHLYIEDLFNFLKTGNLDKIKFISYEI